MTTLAASRRTSLLLLALTLLVGLLSGTTPSTAADPAPNKCGGKSSAVPAQPRTCTFFFKGTPLRFHATSSSSGTARVWITVDGYPEMNGVTAIGCAAAAGRTACGGGYPDETTVADLPHQASTLFVKLRCHFAGSGATWEYGCSAGS